jgi:C4-dicarboxylate-specific signal transduction histidine kinase
MRQVQAKAVLEVTRTVLHEIEAIAGAIALAAKSEMPDFEQSDTYRQIERLSRRLDALGSYRLAATAPRLTEFALGRWIRELVAQEKFDQRTSISYIGQDDLLVEGGVTHIELALCNGLKNAVEAIGSHPARGGPDEPRIIISWDATDVECWIAVKDDGPGLIGEAAETLPIGRSTKENGGGTGLLIAKQAMESLDGSISLTNANGGGALFELRWFGNAPPDR